MLGNFSCFCLSASFFFTITFFKLSGRYQSVNRFGALDTDQDLRLVGSDRGVGPEWGANCVHCKGCLNTLSGLIMHG